MVRIRDYSTAKEEELVRLVRETEIPPDTVYNVVCKPAEQLYQMDYYADVREYHKALVRKRHLAELGVRQVFQATRTLSSLYSDKFLNNKAALDLYVIIAKRLYNAIIDKSPTFNGQQIIHAACQEHTDKEYSRFFTDGKVSRDRIRRLLHSDPNHEWKELVMARQEALLRLLENAEVKDEHGNITLDLELIEIFFEAAAARRVNYIDQSHPYSSNRSYKRIMENRISPMAQAVLALDAERDTATLQANSHIQFGGAVTEQDKIIRQNMDTKGAKLALYAYLEHYCTVTLIGSSSERYTDQLGETLDIDLSLAAGGRYHFAVKIDGVNDHGWYYHHPDCEPGKDNYVPKGEKLIQSGIIGTFLSETDNATVNMHGNALQVYNQSMVDSMRQELELEKQRQSAMLGTDIAYTVFSSMRYATPQTAAAFLLVDLAYLAGSDMVDGYIRESEIDRKLAALDNYEKNFDSKIQEMIKSNEYHKAFAIGGIPVTTTDFSINRETVIDLYDIQNLTELEIRARAYGNATGRYITGADLKNDITLTKHYVNWYHRGSGMGAITEYKLHLALAYEKYQDSDTRFKGTVFSQLSPAQIAELDNKLQADKLGKPYNLNLNLEEKYAKELAAARLAS